MSDINDRVKEIRLFLKLSQEEFGEAIGLSKSGISNIENGVRTVRNNYVRLICSEFCINEEWLRTGNGNPLDEDKYRLWDIPTDELVRELIRRWL